MGNTLKATIYKVEASNNNLFFNNFETILKDLASRLDDSGISQNIRVLDEYKNKETSIWFDSFDYNKDFLQNEILRDSICFLLAKDIDFSIIENKEHKKLDSVVKNANTRPKIPSHCVYIPNKNILIMEESTNSATIGAIKRGVEKNLTGNKETLKFTPVNREDIIKRLYLFLDKIQSIELFDLNLKDYLQCQEDTDGGILDIIMNPNTKLKANLSIVNDKNLKIKIVEFFVKMFEGKVNRELSDITIKFKDENNQEDYVKLLNNLVHLKIQKEHYLDNISEIQNNENRRIEYSKSIYETLLGAYNEYNIQ